MRHRKHGRRFARTPAHGAALRRNLLRNFFLHGRLTTTLPKAKEIRPHVEKLITLARTKTLARIRRALVTLGHDRDLVAKLFDEVGPRFQNRPGGYTRILKLAKPRVGDAAPRARLELVTEEAAAAPSGRPAVADKEPAEEEAEAPAAEESAEEADESADEGGAEASADKGT
jgi:large subunit ribosomal protein L17